MVSLERILSRDDSFPPHESTTDPPPTAAAATATHSAAAGAPALAAVKDALQAAAAAMATHSAAAANATALAAIKPPGDGPQAAAAAMATHSAAVGNTPVFAAVKPPGNAPQAAAADTAFGSAAAGNAAAPALRQRSFKDVLHSVAMGTDASDERRTTKKTFEPILDETLMGSVRKVDGQLVLFFSEEETEALARPYQFSLVGKFSQGAPTMKALRESFVGLGLKGAYSLGAINLKHVFIHLTNEHDFSRLWLKQILFIDGFPMRIFKWSPDFSPKEESSIFPLWVRFPELPIHLFHKRSLHSIASMIGKPLRVDEPTADLSRPSVARVCIEIDLLQPRLDEVLIGRGEKIFKQRIIYENCPRFCNFCRHLGHDVSDCFVNGNKPKPEYKNDGRKHRDLREFLDEKRGKAAQTVPSTGEEIAAAGEAVQLQSSGNSPSGEGADVVQSVAKEKGKAVLIVEADNEGPSGTAGINPEITNYPHDEALDDDLGDVAAEKMHETNSKDAIQSPTARNEIEALTVAILADENASHNDAESNPGLNANTQALVPVLHPDVLQDARRRSTRRNLSMDFDHDNEEMKGKPKAVQRKIITRSQARIRSNSVSPSNPMFWNTRGIGNL